MKNLRLPLLFIACAVAIALLIHLPAYAENCQTGYGSCNPNLSSAQLHQRREGVIVPLLPQYSKIQMKSINVSCEPDFFVCKARNLTVDVEAEFEIMTSDTTVNSRVPIAFPITTHALYGDHNQMKEVKITVDGVEVNYRTAMDYDLWKIYDDSLYYKGRRINSEVHPVLENAADLHSIAPHLVYKGYDLVLLWHLPRMTPDKPTRITIEYTYSSNHFSYCCKEVRNCTDGSDPLFFYFDLSGANQWSGEKEVKLLFSDSSQALWAGVPSIGLDKEITEGEIRFSGSGLRFSDISIPVQPALFTVQPRTWRQSSSKSQEFTLQWNDAFLPNGVDTIVIESIEGVGGINITAELPIQLSSGNPKATFTGAYEMPTAPLAYIDITATKPTGNGALDSLYSSWLRIPLAGNTIMGHDLDIRDAEVKEEHNGQYQVKAEVFNAGQFTEPLTMTVNVNNEFVCAEKFRCMIEPGETKFLTMFVEGDWSLPAEFEVEIEPSPGEVRRHNNSMTTYPEQQLPRRENYILRPDHSVITLIGPDGQYQQSKLHGGIKLFLGDPDVPVIALVGMIGLSVDGAVLYAPDIDIPSSEDAVRPSRGLYMFKDPAFDSIGSYNYLTGEIGFSLYLNTRQGEMPAEQPMRFSGRLTDKGLHVRGKSSESKFPKMTMKIVGHKALKPVKPEIWFSTEKGFYSSRLLADNDGNPPYVSDGDLISSRGYIVATNNELTAQLGIQPIVPDLGLSAVIPGPRGQIWFSFDEDTERIWSETLGRYLQHGDLLSNTGRVVVSNQQLLSRFRPRYTDRADAIKQDLGLNAVALPKAASIYFSTTERFFSEALNKYVGHGDLLSNRGEVIKTNQELLRNFSPKEDLADFGLNAVAVRSDGEIWFSVETGFTATDPSIGYISDGDVISNKGYVVARNHQLLKRFMPVEQIDNFGMNALSVALIDVNKWDYHHAGFGGDIDGDGQVDLRDFTIMAQRWLEYYDIFDMAHLAQRWLE